jgi:hypothetical protein
MVGDGVEHRLRRVNGGMPAMGWAQRTGWAHHVATNNDRLPWLWECIAVFGFIISVGDLLLAAGLLLFAGAELARSCQRFLPRVVGPGMSARAVAGRFGPLR